MSVYVCGDIHGDIDIRKLNAFNWPEQKYVCDEDTLIILGDFGLFWDQDLEKNECYWLKWLLDKKCSIAFIDGNHENHALISTYKVEEKWGGKVHNCFTHNNRSVYHLMRGEVYTIEDKKLFVMGGAESSDKTNRIAEVGWWAEELPNTVEWRNADKNLLLCNNKVDFVLTHTAPASVVEEMELIDTYVPCYGRHSLDYNKLFDPLPKEHDVLLDTISFSQWHFGHFHQDKNQDNKFFCHYNTKPYKLF